MSINYTLYVAMQFIAAQKIKLFTYLGQTNAFNMCCHIFYLQKKCRQIY